MKTSLLALIAFALAAPSVSFAGDSNCDLSAQQATNAIMAQDTCGSGQVTAREALRAYPVIAEILQQQMGPNHEPQWVLQAVYAYLLKFGTPPRDNVWGLLKFEALALERPFWKFRRTEAQVLRSMKVLYGCQE